MHELSIITGVTQIVQKEASKQPNRKVRSVELDIGTLAGIELAALEFAWQSVQKNGQLQGAELIIHSIQAVAKCLDCNFEFETRNLFETCPNCGEKFTAVVKGKELKVKAFTFL